MKKLLLFAVFAIVGAITGCEDAKFPYLVSVAVSPGTPSVSAGSTQQFTAQGTYSNGTTLDLSALVTWSSSTTSVASIVPGGLATANTQGSSTISASFNQPSGMVIGSATLTVTAPILTSIQVSPGNPSVEAGLTQQFTAQGTFGNGTTRDITSEVTWSSSTIYVASIATGGLASTYTRGSSNISASFTQASGTVTGSATLTVAAPALLSIVIIDNSITIPGPNSVANTKTAAGTHHQFSAYGIYTDGGERGVTSSVTWSSSPASVATINNAGIASGLTPGTATITATDPTTSVTQSVPLVVTNATVTAIVVSPANQTIAPLTRSIFSALGEFSDGTTQDVTQDATWSSTNTAVATVTAGIATGVSAGSTFIRAALGGQTGSVLFNVSGASLVSITLTPATSGVAIGSRLLLQAIGTFSDGTTQRLITAVAWSVTPSDGSIATVNSGGLVTGVAAGTATVKAQFGTVSNTATLNVQNLSSIAASKAATPDDLKADSITVTPASAAIAPGTATRFTAIATLADGTTQDVTTSATWISTNPATAIISDEQGNGTSGWASGIAAGSDTIAAVFSGQYAPVPLTVTSATLASIAIKPVAPQSIALGATQNYTATGTFSDSTTQDLTFLVTWSSSDNAVAVIDRFARATSTGVGSTMVKAAANINGSTASDDKALIVVP